MFSLRPLRLCGYQVSIMKNTTLHLMMLLSLLTMPQNGTAEIYKWVDENGNIHFTDNPPHDEAAEEVEVKVNSYTSPQVLDYDEVLGLNKKVVMYSTVSCGYCKRARKYFRTNNIAYADYDIHKTRKGKRDFKKLRGRSVPIILVGKKRLNGFTVARFEEIYQRK